MAAKISGFIEGSYAKEFLRVYNRIVDTDYNGNKYLKVLTRENGSVVGSNHPAVVLANQILRPEGIRTATPYDLGWILESSSFLPLRGQQVDLALLLMGDKEDDEPDNQLLQRLLKQLRDNGLGAPAVAPEVPVMIPLSELDLERADNYYGLAFKLRKDTLAFKLREDTKAINLRKFGKYEDIRLLATKNWGLSGLTLSETLTLIPTWINYSLNYPFDNGRIVIIS